MDTSLRPSRLALGLLLLTIAYNLLEGVIAIAAGRESGSLVLLTFGADSYLEVLAAAAVLWRVTRANDEDGERAEGRARRLIGATFIALAAAVVIQAFLAFAGQHEAETSVPGLTLLAASALLMPLLSLAKLRSAARENIPAMAAEARETIACAYLSWTALAGLAASFVLGWWWVDPLAALLMTPWLIREGLEGLRGDVCFAGERPCFCRPCLFGLRACLPGRDACIPACC